jgi:hemoglobin
MPDAGYRIPVSGIWHLVFILLYLACMKKDIATRADIELLITSFYKKVIVDPLIGYIFNDIAKVDWLKHMPVMFDFWEGALFGNGAYTGNPIAIHKVLNQQIPLTAAHFERWLSLFDATVDELFEGDTSVLAKQRALSIATVIRIKIVSGE